MGVGLHRRSSLVRKSSLLVGLSEVLGYVAAVMAVHVGDLGCVDHGERLEHELLEAGAGHGLVVHEAQLDEVALGGGPDVLDAVELARVGRRAQAFEVLAESGLRLGSRVGRCSIVQ